MGSAQQDEYKIPTLDFIATNREDKRDRRKEKLEIKQYHRSRIKSHKGANPRSRLEARTFKHLNTMLKKSSNYEAKNLVYIDPVTLEFKPNLIKNDQRYFNSTRRPGRVGPGTSTKPCRGMIHSVPDILKVGSLQTKHDQISLLVSCPLPSVVEGKNCRRTALSLLLPANRRRATVDNLTAEGKVVENSHCRRASKTTVFMKKWRNTIESFRKIFVCGNANDL